jgi:hypothetical protein
MSFSSTSVLASRWPLMISRQAMPTSRACAPMLFSRRVNILNRKFPYIAAALDGLADYTILDGEVVALDTQGYSKTCRR